jgi:hypothetical protein
MRWPDLFGTVRAKLLLIVLLPPAIMVPALTGVLVYWGDSAYDKLLVSRVSAEMITAHQYMERVLDANGRAVAGFAESAQLARTISGGLRSCRDRGQRNLTSCPLDAEGRIVACGARRPAAGRTGPWCAKPSMAATAWRSTSSMRRSSPRSLRSWPGARAFRWCRRRMPHPIRAARKPAAC